MSLCRPYPDVSEAAGVYFTQVEPWQMACTKYLNSNVGAKKLVIPEWLLKPLCYGSHQSKQGQNKDVV